mmetsp:Transcript_76637/g.211711  ORF Transcript_76637/g.211711 Transcript_76637/m.211711 type:complete len:224 (-) Transcript_76637:630-1301(-)
MRQPLPALLACLPLRGGHPAARGVAGTQAWSAAGDRANFVVGVCRGTGAAGLARGTAAGLAGNSVADTAAACRAGTVAGGGAGGGCPLWDAGPVAGAAEAVAGAAEAPPRERGGGGRCRAAAPHRRTRLCRGCGEARARGPGHGPGQVPLGCAGARGGGAPRRGRPPRAAAAWWPLAGAPGGRPHGLPGRLPDCIPGGRPRVTDWDCGQLADPRGHRNDACWT